MKGIRPLSFLWCAAVILVFVYICTNTLFHPFNQGSEQIWAARLIILSSLIALANFFAPRWILTVLMPAVVTISALAIIILSGSVFAFLLALVIFAAAAGAGDSVLRLLGIGNDDHPLDGLLISLMTGIGVLGVVTIVLGSLRLLDPLVTGIVLAASVVPAVLRLRSLRGFRQPREDLSEVHETPAVLAVAGYVMLINLIWAVAPEVQYDALNYHLPVPAAYAAAGEIVDLLFVHSYVAGLIDSFYTLAFVFGSQGAAEMIPFGLALVVAASVYSLTRRIAGDRAALWAALLFYTTPVITWAASTTDVDLAVGAFIVTLVLCLVRWHETGRRNWLLVAGIIIGAGIGTKPTFGLVMPAVILFLVVYLTRNREDSISARLRTVVVMTLLAVIVSAPWYLVRARFTGNPLYPGGESIFQSNRPSYGAARALGGNFRIAFSPGTLASFPFLFTYDTDAYSESGVASGGAGPYLLLAVPALWAAVRKRDATLRLIALFACSYVAAWVVIFSYARFFIPALPLLVPLAALALCRAVKKNVAFAVSGFILVFAAQNVVSPVQYWIIPDRIPLRNALGLESDESLLQRALPEFGVVEFLNRAAEPDDVALGLGLERSRHYLRIPFHSFREIPELRLLARIEDPAALAVALRERSYDWLIIDRSEPNNQESYLRQSFADRYGTLRFSSRSHLVYRLKPAT